MCIDLESYQPFIVLEKLTHQSVLICFSEF
nr:MAG TPA: hypothetical protein [Caudoviricetes sp.]